MRAALAFALRRTSARLLFAVGVGGLVLVVYRAVRPLRLLNLSVGPACPTCLSGYGSRGPSHLDLAAAALAAVVAVVAAAALYRRHRISGRAPQDHPLADFRTRRSRAPRTLRFRLLRQRHRQRPG